MVAGAATKTFCQRWIIKEAYPIYACVGVAVAGFFTLIGRSLIVDPQITIAKDKRTNGYTPDVAEGEAHFNHFIRKSSHNTAIGVFPNDWMSQPNTR